MESAEDREHPAEEQEHKEEDNLEPERSPKNFRRNLLGEGSFGVLPTAGRVEFHIYWISRQIVQNCLLELTAYNLKLANISNFVRIKWIRR